MEQSKPLVNILPLGRVSQRLLHPDNLRLPAWALSGIERSKSQDYTCHTTDAREGTFEHDGGCMDKDVQTWDWGMGVLHLRSLQIRAQANRYSLPALRTWTDWLRLTIMHVQDLERSHSRSANCVNNEAEDSNLKLHWSRVTTVMFILAQVKNIFNMVYFFQLNLENSLD